MFVCRQHLCTGPCSPSWSGQSIVPTSTTGCLVHENNQVWQPPRKGHGRVHVVWQRTPETAEERRGNRWEEKAGWLEYLNRKKKPASLPLGFHGRKLRTIVVWGPALPIHPVRQQTKVNLVNVNDPCPRLHSRLVLIHHVNCLAACCTVPVHLQHRGQASKLVRKYARPRSLQYVRCRQADLPFSSSVISRLDSNLCVLLLFTGNQWKSIKPTILRSPNQR